MFVYIGRRAQIADVLSGRRTAARTMNVVTVEHPLDLPRLDAQSFAAIWSEHPSDRWRMPEVLVIADGSERDWLAWLINFAPSLRPFTAFCRVIEAGTFAQLAESFQPADLGRLETACVGLVLGEVLSSEDVLSRLPEPLTTSACASVLSFALVRELALYRHSPRDDEHELPRRWTQVRQLTRQRERGLDWREVAGVVEVLRALLREGPSGAARPIVRACQELVDRADVSLLGGAFSSRIAEAAREMTGTREERVAIFERTMAASLATPGPREDAFAIGYLASRINPGTLTHAAVVAPALPRYPSAMLWYGVCAGLADDNGVLGELGGVGRRLLRELTIPDAILGRPRADIAAAELEILLSGERTDEFPVYSPSQLSVELIPGVSTVLNWSSRARSRRTQGSTERIDNRERSWMEYELGAAISRLIDLHNRIRSGDQAERATSVEELPAEGQSNLFDRPPPYRRGGSKRR